VDFGGGPIQTHRNPHNSTIAYSFGESRIDQGPIGRKGGRNAERAGLLNKVKQVLTAQGLATGKY